MPPIASKTLIARAAVACAAWSPAAPHSGGSVQSATIQACSLLSNADVEKISGRHMFTAPDATSLAGGAGSACTFDVAQLVLFSGDRSEERWNAYLKNFGHENDKRYPVPGIGGRAYAFYPKPRDEYEGRNAVVVVTAGQHTIGVSVEADEGQPVESVQPQAIALAKLVVAKLR